MYMVYVRDERVSVEATSVFADGEYIYRHFLYKKSAGWICIRYRESDFEIWL